MRCGHSSAAQAPREDAWPLPRVRCVLSPCSVVLLVHLTLLGSGAGLLSPRGGVLLQLHHLHLWSSTVVECSCQSHADGLLLMPQHGTQPPLTSSPSGSRTLELPARFSRQLATQWKTPKDHKLTRRKRTCLNPCVVVAVVVVLVVVVVVVVVVVRTECMTCVSLHACQRACS